MFQKGPENITRIVRSLRQINTCINYNTNSHNLTLTKATVPALVELPKEIEKKENETGDKTTQNVNTMK